MQGLICPYIVGTGTVGLAYGDVPFHITHFANDSSTAFACLA